MGFDVSKDRVLYRENAEGRIENVYSLKIMNKDQQDHTYVLDAAGLPDLKLQGKREIKVAAGDIVSLPVELSIAPEKLPSSTNEVFFILKDADNNDINVKAKSRFIGPQIRDSLTELVFETKCWLKFARLPTGTYFPKTFSWPSQTSTLSFRFHHPPNDELCPASLRLRQSDM